MSALARPPMPGAAPAPSARELLVVAFHFPPLASSGTFRTLGFVRHLASLGWRSTVVAARSWAGVPRDEALADDVPPGTRVLRTPVPDFVGAAARRRTGARGADGAARPPGLLRSAARAASAAFQVPDPQAAFAPAAFAAGLAAVRAIGRRPDAILASGPPMSGLVAGACLARVLRRPLVADFRDPWVGSPFREVPPALRAWDAALERLVVRTAAACLANTPLLREGFAARHPAAARRLVVLENGFDGDAFDALRRVEAAPRANRALEILHAGAIYGPRDPSALLAALRRLVEGERPDPAPRLRFVGHHPGEEFLARARAALGAAAPLVAFEPDLPHRAALAAIAAADVLLVVGLAGEADEVQVPAKLFEYLASGRPILALASGGGAIADVLRQSTARSWIAPIGDVERQLAALREIVAAGRRGELARGPSALPPRYERRRQAEALDRLLRELAAPGGAGR